MMLTLLNWATVAVWLVWFIFYWGAEIRVMADIRETLVKASNSRLDRLLVIVLAFSIVPLFVTTLAAAAGWVVFSQQEILAAVGWLVAAGGLAAAFHARHFLGRFWTAITTVQRNHLVIDRGPYGIVRHPIYTATIAIYLGTLMVFPGLWTAFLFIVLTVAYGLKALDEERFLMQHLGAAYASYSQRVRYRLVPGIW